jgi:hypothetical protein
LSPTSSRLGMGSRPGSVVGDNPALPPERAPFPEPDEELPETEHPSSL